MSRRNDTVHVITAAFAPARSSVAWGHSIESSAMSTWQSDALNQLATALKCGYRAAAPTASEPAALAAMALVAHGNADGAAKWRRWLAEHQSPDGSLGINAAETDPCWPTALAILAWRAHDAGTPESSPFAKQTSAAVRWLLRVSGEPVERSPGMGHDPTLIGWPWVLGTHSWIEPTAWAVLALKATGHAEHPRTREAVSLLIDRLLIQGGCNYGNTMVLGQILRPHLEPTGVTMLALAGEKDSLGRIDLSVEYLARTLNAETPAASLAYGLLGLNAHHRSLAHSADWLAGAYQRQSARGFDPLRVALLLLAAAGSEAPPIKLPVGQGSP